jgi:hypothetical protein
MTGGNHYQVLGVRPDADLSQIRAAYVALLKRYHPDGADANDAQETGAQVHRIVRAYRILKDSRTRAAYDAALRQIASPIPHLRMAPARAGPAHRTWRRFRPDWDTISYVLMFVAAAVGLQLLVSRLLNERWPHSGGTVVAGTPSVRGAAEQARLEAVVRNAGMMSGMEASNYSARCFAAARSSRNPASADPCVGFDMAYVYWRETTGGPLVVDPYFQPDAMNSRVRAAFGRLSSTAAAARVQSLRAVTLRAIMRTPRAADEFSLALSGGQGGGTLTGKAEAVNAALQGE